MPTNNIGGEEQELFTAFLVSKLGPEDFEKKLADVPVSDIKELYKQFKTMENQITFAKLGSKLEHIKMLNGKCPEGYEVEKFMKGGCVKCRKKLEKADKNFMNEFKCGGKSKMRVSRKK